MLRLERADLDGVDWNELDGFADRSVFQTEPWLEFLIATQNGEPIIARVLEGDADVGWFTGIKVRHLGVPILGSPLRGWTSGPMGFNLRPGVSRREAIEALVRFAFGELRCLYLELLDRRIGFAELERLPQAEAVPFRTFEVDLTPGEDEVFGAMSSACRRAVRKGAKVGVRVERAHGEGFADEYYSQLEDVFAKQAKRPPYRVERVRELIRRLEPSDRLTMLRAVDSDGRPIASAIFPFCDGFAYFWGGASWRGSQNLRPNEAIFWQAMREFKQRGIPTLDLGGAGDYKRKYGAAPVERPFLRRARLPGLLVARRVAGRVLWRVRTRTRRGGGG